MPRAGAFSDAAHSAGLSPRNAILRERLRVHPLYGAVRDPGSLRVFMQHHVYAVWDFMSLIKALQRHLAPVSLPWTPPGDPRHAWFINRLVLEEESDAVLGALTGVGHTSHFETYLRAMQEIGADTTPVRRFIGEAGACGAIAALHTAQIPAPARRFMMVTLDIALQGAPHEIAAAMAYGREDILPDLFRALLERLPFDAVQAPNLFGYLKRHVELDECEHGPMAIAVVRDLCGGSERKRAQAEIAVERSLTARVELWDAILSAASGSSV